jgi:mycothiol synthase
VIPAARPCGRLIDVSYSSGTLDLPGGWASATPSSADVGELHALLLRYERAGRGASSASLHSVESDVVGAGAATRRHLAVRDDVGLLRGWATVHDRAAGRSVVAVVVEPGLEQATADRLAHALLDWSIHIAAEIASGRGLHTIQIDSGAFAGDSRQQRWLAQAGLQHVRSWWQMSRPVQPQEAEPGVLPEPGPDLVVRRVRRDDDDGLPRQSDLAAVHGVLEAAFTDHFNYHEETFEEFCSRLREDPGHRWDHWWIAEVVEEGSPPQPAGALVAAVSPGEGGAADSSYVEYLGVLRSARGRGAARSLLHAVFADAARRGRASVGIEVDQDSPTGAAGLYLSMGFVTSYVTQSWHRDLPVAG